MADAKDDLKTSNLLEPLKKVLLTFSSKLSFDALTKLDPYITKAQAASRTFGIFKEVSTSITRNEDIKKLIIDTTIESITKV